MKLAVQEQILPGRTLQEKFAFAVDAGFEAIELRGKGGFQFASRLPELKRALADGVVMPTVCVDMPHYLGDFDPGRRRDAVHELRSQLTVIAELGGIGVIAPASWGQVPRESPRSVAEDREVLAESLGVLGEHAARSGVLFMLEPLNRYEDHMVNTIAQASALCVMSSLKVVGDMYHMNIEEDDPCRSMVMWASYLAHIQVSESNRSQPGTGHLDWATQLTTLDAIGYDGYLTLECRLRGEPEVVLPQSAAFLRKFLSTLPV